jgi:hypothetical protein
VASTGRFTADAVLASGLQDGDAIGGGFLRLLRFLRKSSGQTPGGFLRFLRFLRKSSGQTPGGFLRFLRFLRRLLRPVEGCPGGLFSLISLFSHVATLAGSDPRELVRSVQMPLVPAEPSPKGLFSLISLISQVVPSDHGGTGEAFRAFRAFRATNPAGRVDVGLAGEY